VVKEHFGEEAQILTVDLHNLLDVRDAANTFAHLIPSPIDFEHRDRSIPINFISRGMAHLAFRLHHHHNSAGEYDCKRGHIPDVEPR
jgi:hypothetical protein